MAEKKSTFPGFLGGSYTDNNRRYDCQRTVNYYTQQDESMGGKERSVTSLLQRPGLKFLQNIPPGPIRQLALLSDNATFIVVSGNQVYQLSSGTSTPVNIVGQLTTSSGFISISDNGGYVIIVDGTMTYYTFEIGSTVLTNSTDPHYYGASQVTYQDGFFLFVQPGSPNIFTSTNSAPEGGTTGGGPIAFVADNVAVKQGYADIVVGIISNARELFIWGTQTGEVWSDTGGESAEGTSVPFSFDREDGKNTQVGCISQATIVQLAGTTFWLGQNPQGGAIVYYMNGYVPTRVSTHAVEHALSELGDLSNSYAYSIQYEGHYFYVLQPTGSQSTWVYDVSAISDLNPSNGLWTEWQSTTAANRQGPFLGNSHVYVAGQHLLGDSQGNLFQFDPNTFTDNGSMLRRMRQTPHVSKNLNHCFYKLLQVDFLAGQGLVMNGLNTSNAVKPRAVLEYSDDGGQTWSGPIYTGLGAIGRYLTRARWQRLGQAYDRVFRVTVTDPVSANIVVAELDFEVGNA